MSNGPSEEQHRERRSPWGRVIGAAVGLACLAVLAVVVWQLKANQTGQEARSRSIEEILEQLTRERADALTEIAALKQELETLKMTGVSRPGSLNRTPVEPAVNHEARAADTAAVRQVELARLLSRLHRMEADLQALQTQVTDWDVRVSSLLGDEPGRRLAARPDLVRQFAAVVQKERTSLSGVRGFREQVDVLRTGLEEFFEAEVTALPSDAFRQLLGDVERAIATAVRQYDADRGMLDSLMNQVAAGEPGQLTLADAMHQVELAQAQDHAQRVQTARQQALDAATGDLTEQEQKRIRAAIDLEIQASQTATDADEKEFARRLAKKKVDDAANAARLERDRLMREALRPEVLDLLAPLITPDFVQPRQIVGFGAQGQQMPESEPVSLRRLKMLGVLDRNEKGMQRLVLLNSSDWTDRPRWNMKYEATEPSLWNKLQRETITKMQEYLIKYGDVLVEAGKLAE